MIVIDVNNIRLKQALRANINGIILDIACVGISL